MSTNDSGSLVYHLIEPYIPGKDTLTLVAPLVTVASFLWVLTIIINKRNKNEIRDTPGASQAMKTIPLLNRRPSKNIYIPRVSIFDNGTNIMKPWELDPESSNLLKYSGILIYFVFFLFCSVFFFVIFVLFSLKKQHKTSPFDIHSQKKGKHKDP